MTELTDIVPELMPANSVAIPISPTDDWAAYNGKYYQLATVSAESDFTFSNGTITDYVGNGGMVIIPQTIGGVAVTAINANVFRNSVNLQKITGVVFPYGMTTLGLGQMLGGGSLISAIIPETVTGLNGYTFYGCTSLQKVTLPSDIGTVLQDSEFSSCSRLTDIVLPGNLVEIKAGAFGGCSLLTSIGGDLPRTLTTIGGSAFGYCSKIEAMTLPSGLTSVGDSAFRACRFQSPLIIPSGLIAYPGNCFFGLLGVTKVTFPVGADNFGNYSFGECSLLREAHFEGNAPTVFGSNVFAPYSGFKITYNTGATGWTNPWNGFTTEEVSP